MPYPSRFKMFPEVTKKEIPETIEDIDSVSINLGILDKPRMPSFLTCRIVSFRGIKEPMLLPEVFKADDIYIDTPALLMDPRIADYEVCYRKTPTTSMRRWKGKPIDPEDIRFFQNKTTEEMIPYLKAFAKLYCLTFSLSEALATGTEIGVSRP